jgi:hypothetical protein
MANAAMDFLIYGVIIACLAIMVYEYRKADIGPPKDEEDAYWRSIK